MIKPDYLVAEVSAYHLLEDFRLNELPVNIECLFNVFPDLRIKTYTWFAKQQGISIDEVIEITDSESGCCWYMPDKAKYLILYNDIIPNKGRIRWTIAHELGHYRLRHNEKSDRTIINRNSLTTSEYDAFEKEANCFARSLLAPTSVLASMGHLDVMTIVNTCDISFEAASNVKRFIKKGFDMGRRVYPENRITVLFRKTIFEHVHGHTCMECRTVFAGEICYYCSVCGSASILKGRGYNNMLYSGHEVDEEGRLKKCARCQNEEIGNEDEFCKVCSSPVVNRCTNSDYDYHKVVWECGGKHSGNARYCTSCGNETIFLRANILKSWTEEAAEREALRSLREADKIFGI